LYILFTLKKQEPIFSTFQPAIAALFNTIDDLGLMDNIDSDDEYSDSIEGFDSTLHIPSVQHIPSADFTDTSEFTRSLDPDDDFDLASNSGFTNDFGSIDKRWRRSAQQLCRSAGCGTMPATIFSHRNLDSSAQQFVEHDVQAIDLSGLLEISD
jgi:hypothetical protein